MENSEPKLVIDCPLCGEHEVNVQEGGEDSKIMQCLNCGFSTEDRFYIGLDEQMENTEKYKSLDKWMKKWAKSADGYIWIPSVMSLPVGVYYPKQDEGDKEMVWAFSPLVQIPEEEQKNYPIPGQEGKYYKQKYDVDNEIKYGFFKEGIVKINMDFGEKTEQPKKPQMPKVKLPKLKKK
tara:strand:+ start:558 stop:1094 length:537 start_codon:yes stop_codon:yes gene_type:complete